MRSSARMPLVMMTEHSNWTITGHLHNFIPSEVSRYSAGLYLNVGLVNQKKQTVEKLIVDVVEWIHRNLPTWIMPSRRFRFDTVKWLGVS